MTRRYEIVYIFESALDETQVNAALDRHQALLKPQGATEFILETNHWGRRTLAYPIGKNEVGYYVVVNLKTTGDLLAEFERSVKLDESIIRYLIVLIEGQVPVPIPPPHESDGDGDDERPRGKPRSEPAKAAPSEPAKTAASEPAKTTEAEPAKTADSEPAKTTEAEPAKTADSESATAAAKESDQ